MSNKSLNMYIFKILSLFLVVPRYNSLIYHYFGGTLGIFAATRIASRYLCEISTRLMDNI
jgi:uncharacterized membrane protein